ncbi:MAG: 4Fe-4S binding protein [Candidatus Riflebacteria bacterium]|nr:4Fe-4S binding protein [Candidatus Riflebacteria bacterium]
MRYLERAVTLEIEPSRCNGCGMCASVCPHAVFRLEDHRAVMADRGACMECGACARNCPQQAIRVRSGVGCAAALLAGGPGCAPTCGPKDGPTSCC